MIWKISRRKWNLEGNFVLPSTPWYQCINRKRVSFFTTNKKSKEKLLTLEKFILLPNSKFMAFVCLKIIYNCMYVHMSEFRKAPSTEKKRNLQQIYLLIIISWIFLLVFQKFTGTRSISCFINPNYPWHAGTPSHSALLQIRTNSLDFSIGPNHSTLCR